MHPLAFGYNTNGFAHHRLEDALEIIAGSGYEGVALTLDVHHLDPLGATDEEIGSLREKLTTLGLRCVIETGGRFLLDPSRKHYPNLLSPEGGERRLDLLLRAVRIAAGLGAEVVSLWSGVPDPGAREGEAEGRLQDGLTRICQAAEQAGIRIALEPEPGMLVDTLKGFDDLKRAVPSPALGLTLDIGHAHCTETVSIPDIIRRYGKGIWNVHIEDAPRDAHLHLPFGEGTIDFPPILSALREIRYEGLVAVELSRNSHDAPLQARRSIEFLRGIE